MTHLRHLLAVAVAVLCAVAPAAAAPGNDVEKARLAFRITDPRVTESSGLAVSRTHPGLAYTVNDSGDDARVLVVSRDDGDVVGETRLAGVSAVDLEALAPAPRGRLVVADIGDNGSEREAVDLYVIDEPRRGAAEVVPRRVSLSYPDGPRNAEAVVVAGRRVFVVTKEILGGSVLTAPVLRSAHDAYGLRRVAPAPSLVTDAARVGDDLVVLRDYHRAYVVRLPSWRRVTSYPLPSVEQGETVAALPGRRAVYVGSEGDDSPVFVLPVPGSVEGATADPVAQQKNEPDDEVGRPRARPPGYVVAVALTVIIGVLVRRHRRRR